MKNEKQSKVWAVSSLVTGILSIILFLMPYFALPLGIMAIIFYAQQRDSAMSKAGLVLGIIGCVMGVSMSLLMLMFLLI